MYVQFCGVQGLENGTRCRDGVKVLWSFLSCLVGF